VRETSGEVDALRQRIAELNEIGLLTPDQIAELDTAQQSLQDLEFASQGAAHGFEVIGPAVDTTADALAGLSINTTDTVDALGRLPLESTSEAMARLLRESAAAAGGMAGAAVEARRGADGFTEISNAAAESAVHIREGADGLKEITDGAAHSTVELKRHGAASKEASEQAGDLGANTGKTADALTKLGPAAEQASERVARAMGPIEEAIERNRSKAESLLSILERIANVSFSGGGEGPTFGGAGHAGP
jgi:uncharacterized phage infection (PIP) family protein YhgE